MNSCDAYIVKENYIDVRIFLEFQNSTKSPEMLNSCILKFWPQIGYMKKASTFPHFKINTENKTLSIIPIPKPKH